ncbi:MAG: hypothetical protein WBA77_02485 [Microcoleaceae cyanobacterium]
MVTNGTNPPTPAQSESQNPNQPIVVEDYADRLIEDLFTDVERVLDGGAKLPSKAVQPEFVSLKSIQVPTIVLPETETSAINPSDRAIDPEVVRVESADTANSSLDRWLLGAAFTSLVITLGLWVATRGGFSRLFAPAPVAVSPETTVKPINPADAEFAGYVGRSLNAIQKRAVAVPTLPLVPPLPAPNATLPALPVPGTPTSSPTTATDTNSLIQSINRVANTVESASREMASLSNRVMNALNTQLQQSPQAQVQTPTPGGQTSGSSSTVANAPATEQNVAEATPETTPETTESPQEESTTVSATPQTTEAETAPVAAAPIPQALPAPESIPAVSIPPSTPAPQTQASAISANPEPAIIHTLVGILELGERSAALFEVDGVPRRIYIGENIAGSGWTLVEVANQEAVMRRNGEVRTIFVGQQF